MLTIKELLLNQLVIMNYTNDPYCIFALQSLIQHHIIENDNSILDNYVTISDPLVT